MKVLRLHGKGDLRIHDEPDPVPEPDEQVVNILAAGICGSDLHWVDHGGVGEAQVVRPLVLGHEFAGTITNADGRETQVAVDPAISCGTCRSCQEGHPNLCNRIRFTGYGMDDGALREYMAWPARCIHPLPAGMSAIDGVVLEPGQEYRKTTIYKFSVK
jgi:L-iditol 2-dehydrogenase